MGVAISANTYLIIHTLFKMADMAAAAPLSIGTDSVVSCVEFGPCHQYTALLAASTASTLVIKKCTLKVQLGGARGVHVVLTNMSTRNLYPLLIWCS